MSPPMCSSSLLAIWPGRSRHYSALYLVRFGRYVLEICWCLRSLVNGVIVIHSVAAAITTVRAHMNPPLNDSEPDGNMF